MASFSELMSVISPAVSGRPLQAGLETGAKLIQLNDRLEARRAQQSEMARVAQFQSGLQERLATGEPLSLAEFQQIALHDPAQARALGALAEQEARARSQRLKADTERELQALDGIRRVVKTIKDEPTYRAARQALLASDNPIGVTAGESIPEAFPGMAYVDSSLQTIDLRRMFLEGAPEAKGRVAQFLQALNVAGVPLESPEGSAAAKEFLESEFLETRSPGDTHITVDARQPLTTGAKTELQRQFISNAQILSDAESVSALGDVGDLLTRQGKLKVAVAVELDKLGLSTEGQKITIARDSQLSLRVEQVIQTVRRLVTGAAAPMAELERLEKTLLSKSMSPQQFKTALIELQDRYTRAVRLNQMMLAEGIDLDDESIRGKLISARWNRKDVRSNRSAAEKVFEFQLAEAREELASEITDPDELNIAASDRALEVMAASGWDLDAMSEAK